MSEPKAMQIEHWPLDKIIPYARNPRKISDKAVSKVAASIQEYGWRQAIVVDTKGVIIVGHTRLAAARKLGMKEAPVHVAIDLTPQQIKAYRLADNRTNQENEWDNDLLSIELEELNEDFDLSLTGFDPDEIANLFGIVLTEGNTDPDDVPEPPVNPVTVRGDVWIMGNHRLMCGDSTDVAGVEMMMGGVKADFCFTSPPYNAATSLNIEGEGKSLYLDNTSDDRTSAEYIQFNQDIFATMSAISSKDFTCCYNVNYNRKSPSEYIDVVYAAKQVMPLRETIAWEKTMAVTLHGDNLTRIFEFVFVFAKGKFKINKNKTDCLKNLWRITNIGANHKDHKACFPVELPEQGIRYFAPHGGVIFEPFGGTGTTLIAAEKTGCKARLMELDPRYCDVIVKRWQDYTGQQATLEGDGRTFNEVCEARYAGGDWAKNCAGSYDDAVAAAHVKLSDNGKTQAAE